MTRANTANNATLPPLPEARWQPGLLGRHIVRAIEGQFIDGLPRVVARAVEELSLQANTTRLAYTVMDECVHMLPSLYRTDIERRYRDPTEERMHGLEDAVVRYYAAEQALLSAEVGLRRIGRYYAQLRERAVLTIAGPGDEATGGHAGPGAHNAQLQRSRVANRNDRTMTTEDTDELQRALGSADQRRHRGIRQALFASERPEGLPVSVSTGEASYADVAGPLSSEMIKTWEIREWIGLSQRRRVQVVVALLQNGVPAQIIAPVVGLRVPSIRAHARAIGCERLPRGRPRLPLKAIRQVQGALAGEMLARVDQGSLSAERCEQILGRRIDTLRRRPRRNPRQYATTDSELG